MHANGLSLKIMLRTDLKPNRGYYFQFYNKVGESKVLIHFNLFKLLFCILHFCILGQTQKMAAMHFWLWNEEKHDV